MPVRREVRVMKCPECGLHNPEEAAYCDCGYQFVAVYYRPEPPPAPVVWARVPPLALRFPVTWFLCSTMFVLNLNVSLMRAPVRLALGGLALAFFWAGVVTLAFPHAPRKEVLFAAAFVTSLLYVGFLFFLGGPLGLIRVGDEERRRIAGMIADHANVFSWLLDWLLFTWIWKKSFVATRRG